MTEPRPPGRKLCGAAPSPPPPQTTRHRLNRGGHRYSFLLAGSRNQLRSFTGAARIVTVDMFKPVLSFECCSGGHTCTCPRLTS